MIEITPIGVQNIGRRFWIVWTVFNAAFIPITYVFYPEIGLHLAITSNSLASGWRYSTADRTLEDMDTYYRTNFNLIIIEDPDATSARFPSTYIEHEQNKVQKKLEVMP